jgi:hypothetical protein
MYSNKVTHLLQFTLSTIIIYMWARRCYTYSESASWVEHAIYPVLMCLWFQHVLKHECSLGPEVDRI